MDNCHKPGTSATIEGFRGAGKTHHMVNIFESLISWDYDVLTNVIFKKRKSTKNIEFIQDYPPHIQKTVTLWKIFENIALLFDKYGNDKKAIVGLDEVSLKAHAYRYNDDLPFYLQLIQADARKWGYSTIMATPLQETIPAMLRRYAIIHYFKSREMTMYYSKKYNLSVDREKGMIFCKSAELEGIVPIVVTVGKYNKQWEDLKPGEYVYDHMASARLDIGPDWFKPEDLISVYGDVASEDIASVTLEYRDKNIEKYESKEEKDIIKDFDRQELIRYIYKKCNGGPIKAKIKGSGLREIELNSTFFNQLTDLSPKKILEILEEIEINKKNDADDNKNDDKKDDSDNEI